MYGKILELEHYKVQICYLNKLSVSGLKKIFSRTVKTFLLHVQRGYKTKNTFSFQHTKRNAAASKLPGVPKALSLTVQKLLFRTIRPTDLIYFIAKTLNHYQGRKS